MRMCKRSGCADIKIIDIIWCKPNTYHYLNTGRVRCICIVKFEDTNTGEVKQYTAYRECVNKADEDLIIARGCKFQMEKNNVQMED